MKTYYDIIFVYETNFQKKIVSHIIKYIIKDETYLKIDARNQRIKFYDQIININLNGFSGVVKSLKDLFTKRSKLKCNKLVGTLIVSPNSRFFECFIEHKKLVLIDDGIGTPIVIDNPTLLYKRLLFNLSSALAKIVSFFAGYKLKSTRNILSKISFYWTIYPISNQRFIPKEDISFFKQDIHPVVKNEVAFIGQPMVETKIMDFSKYWNSVKIVQERERAISYYPHPAEGLYKKIEITDICIKKGIDLTIEEYFLRHGIPKKIVSYSSTALINIQSYKIEGVECYYIKSEHVKNAYYKLLDTFGIQEYILYETE
ncbi:hypothetical protein [Dysgonomonas sp.]